MSAVPPYIIEPIGEPFRGMLPGRDVDLLLGCHCTRISDRVVLEKLVRVLVFGCAYSGGSSTRDALPPPSAADATIG